MDALLWQILEVLLVIPLGMAAVFIADTLSRLADPETPRVAPVPVRSEHLGGAHRPGRTI